MGSTDILLACDNLLHVGRDLVTGSPLRPDHQRWGAMSSLGPGQARRCKGSAERGTQVEKSSIWTTLPIIGPSLWGAPGSHYRPPSRGRGARRGVSMKTETAGSHRAAHELRKHHQLQPHLGGRGLVYWGGGNKGSGTVPYAPNHPRSGDEGWTVFGGPPSRKGE